MFCLEAEDIVSAIADKKKKDALPTVLAYAGVKFLHMGINPGCKQKEFLDKLPVLSWWEGPDGSRVLLGFSSGYGWMGWGSLTPPKGWRHKTCYGDPAEFADAILAEEKANPTLVKMLPVPMLPVSNPTSLTNWH